MPVLEIKDLSHVYSAGTPFEKTALDHIDLSVEAGEFVGVIGHTGSGKSTLIQHLNGLLKPTSGEILVDGQNIWEDKKNLRGLRFKVGLVFQYPEYQLFEETVYKDIAFGPKNMGLKEEEVDERVREAARFVGIPEELMEKSPFELSGGQKRRAAIAGVIAMDPRVLILDEPTAGLDPKGRDRILGRIKEYHQVKQNTILLVSHSMEDIAKYATKVLVMNKARVFTYGTVDEVFSKSDAISHMGLSIPQISKVFHALGEKGYPVNRNIYTVEGAKQEILKRLSKGTVQ
ncbi:MAG: energy-coupling factor transporter ATPase [Oscillospiraceae bacterium]|nr:energy-coupling factor transporter ATPase [Oscillospiraceae bacterium]